MISPEMNPLFTMNGAIPVFYAQGEDPVANGEKMIFGMEQIQAYVEKVRKGETLFERTDRYLHQALSEHRTHVVGKNIAVLESRTPWYESVALAYGARPTRVGKEKVSCADPRVETITWDELENKRFDAVFAISHIEECGLKEPLKPNGDLEAMKKIKTILKQDGLLFLAVPISEDLLVWNRHRVYGKLRLKSLLRGWRILGYFGFSYEHLDLKEKNHRPIFVLKPLN